MQNVRIWTWIACLVMTLWGCDRQQDHKGKTPLVEVAGKFLYQEDLRTALPLNLSAEDSVLFAENYIRTWIEDILLFDKAEDNIRDTEKVKALVENYRRALVMHAYQEELVNQQLSREISPMEVARYYESSKSLFVLEKPLVKGLFIKVPLGASGLSNVRRWYKKKHAGCHREAGEIQPGECGDVRLFLRPLASVGRSRSDASGKNLGIGKQLLAATSGC